MIPGTKLKSSLRDVPVFSFHTSSYPALRRVHSCHTCTVRAVLYVIPGIPVRSVWIKYCMYEYRSLPIGSAEFQIPPLCVSIPKRMIESRNGNGGQCLPSKMEIDVNTGPLAAGTISVPNNLPPSTPPNSCQRKCINP